MARERYVEEGFAGLQGYKHPSRVQRILAYSDGWVLAFFDEWVLAFSDEWVLAYSDERVLNSPRCSTHLKLVAATVWHTVVRRKKRTVFFFSY